MSRTESPTRPGWLIQARARFTPTFQLSSQSICLVLLNFRFQKCRHPNPLLDPVSGSKSELGLLRHFQLSSQNICLVLLNFRFQKCSDPNPRLDPVGGSKPEPSLLQHFQLSSQNILFVLFHFRLFNYVETLHYGQAHKHLQLTKCIYN